MKQSGPLFSITGKDGIAIGKFTEGKKSTIVWYNLDGFAYSVSFYNLEHGNLMTGHYFIFGRIHEELHHRFRVAIKKVVGDR